MTVLMLASLSIVEATLPDPLPPPAIRCVQVHASKVSPETGELIDRSGRADVIIRLDEAGFGPAWEKVIDEGDLGIWSYLLVGKLHYLPDAILLKHDLRAAGFEGAYERAFRNEDRIDFPMEIKSGREPHVMRQVRSEESALTEDERKLVLEMRTGDAEAIRMAEERIQSRMASRAFEDALPVYRLRASVHEERRGVLFPIQRQEDQSRFDHYQEILVEPLIRIARGETEAGRAEQIEAGLLVGELFHEYTQNRIRAYRAYSEVLNVEDLAPAEEARARVMRAALLLELARSDLAFHNEVQRECAIIARDVPERFRNAHAVADLIHWESKLIEGEGDEQAIEALQSYHTRFPNHLREISMSYFQAAVGHARHGRFVEAIELLEEILGLELTSGDLFTWGGDPVDIKGQARNQIVYFEHLLKERRGVDYQPRRSEVLDTGYSDLVDDKGMTGDRFSMEVVK